MNNVIIALSNEEMIKINFVDLEKLYNFVVEKLALGKDTFCRVPKNSTRQNTPLPSARKKALGKDAFCRVPKNSTRQNISLPSARK